MQAKPLPYTAETLKEVRAANLPKLLAIAAIAMLAERRAAKANALAYPAICAALRDKGGSDA